jgi:glutamate/tyrosine decarboxylase-like PLP-dependent enzyme
LSASAFDDGSVEALRAALSRLGEGFAALPRTPGDGADAAASDAPRKLGPDLERVLLETATRLQDNYPYFHPLYAGQMLKPPHPVARLAYALSLWINPNNHALDGGRASSAMEKEAVGEIAAMFGWKAHLGHLCGGGTMANLEALWVAGRTRPGEAIAASSQAHYTHSRISGVLGLEFVEVPCDRRGRMDLAALERLIGAGKIGTVVATLGTTAVGAVDPLLDLLELRRRHGFRIHVDAAYGGYYTLVDALDREARAAFGAIGEADSIVVDPHKHGLQPYGCGCVLFRDPGVGRLYRHDSPYTYFTSGDLHLGEISLECSRPGASAVALWATQRLLPLTRGGDFARSLERCRDAALSLWGMVSMDSRFAVPFRPELDILVWGVRAPTAAESTRRARRVFEEAARRGLHLALAELPLQFFDGSGLCDGDSVPTVGCLRSVLMKPEHEAWVPRIASILSEAADAGLGGLKS